MSTFFRYKTRSTIYSNLKLSLGHNHSIYMYSLAIFNHFIISIFLFFYNYSHCHFMYTQLIQQSTDQQIRTGQTLVLATSGVSLCGQLFDKTG